VKSLLLKSALLLAPFIALGTPAVVHTLDMIVQAERSTSLRDGVFNAQLEGKWLTLVKPGIEVLVAGDSRAERQIVPAVIETVTGWKAANIGTNACDLITLQNAIVRHPLPASVRVLIVSASIFQANDGAIDAGYMSTACLLNMTPWERIRVYADRLGSPWSALDFQFIEGPPAPIGELRLREGGLLPVEKQLALPLPKTLLDRHPWYRNLSLSGARWRIFREALGRLAERDVRIYLVQSPASPAWRGYTAGTFVDAGEREYSAMLETAVAPYPNVRFLDFYTTIDPQLGNESYYDIQHLNRRGAEAFTRTIVGLVLADLGKRDAGASPKTPRP